MLFSLSGASLWPKEYVLLKFWNFFLLIFYQILIIIFLPLSIETLELYHPVFWFSEFIKNLLRILEHSYLLEKAVREKNFEEELINWQP